MFLSMATVASPANGAAKSGDNRKTGASGRTARGRGRRLVRLTDLLRSSAFGFTVQQLVDHFGVCRRTVFRDLHLLREAGISARFDPMQHAVTAKPHFPPSTLRLTPEQMLILALAARTSLLRTDRGFGFAIDKAIAALLSRMPEETRTRATRLMACCLVEAGVIPGECIAEPAIHNLVLAVSHNHPVRLQYRSSNPSDRTIRTKVTRCQFVVAHRNWYLLGWSTFHRKWCRFEPARIESVEVINETVHGLNMPLRPWRTPVA